MDWFAIGAIIGAISGVGALVNSFINTSNNKKNSNAVASLETGKLDLGVAALGLQAMQAALEELRLQVQECHDDKAALEAQLQYRKDLSPTD